MSFVTVSIKSKDRSYSQKFVANGPDMPDITMDHDNKKLQMFVEEAEKHFGEKANKITVTATIEW